MEYSKVLSIIIPVYNVQKYLKRCVESVILQCDKDIEIILVDDGSKDLSGDICDKYAKEYPNIITAIHKTNGGLSTARNVGLDYAKGRYVFFLDSDDCVTEYFIQSIKNKLVSDKYDIIEFECCWEREFNKYMPKKHLNRGRDLSAGQCIENILKNKMGNQICLRVYKKKLFHNIRFPIGKNYEDISTNYKLILNASKIFHLESELYIYNITNVNSITKKNNITNMNDMYMAVNELCHGVSEFCQRENIDMIYVEYYKRQSYIYIILKLMNLGKEAEKLQTEILTYLQNNNYYNLFKYRYYDWKRWLYFEMLLVVKKYNKRK